MIFARLLRKWWQISAPPDLPALTPPGGVLICRQLPRRHANLTHHRAAWGSAGKLARLLGEWWPIGTPSEEVVAN